MELYKLSKLKGRQKKAKRVGRGMGSGKGSHTTGKGQKGQKSRSGYNLPVGFEGGQVPLFRKMPKSKGFVNSHRQRVVILSLLDLAKFKDNEKITPEVLSKKGLIKNIENAKIKILGDGEISTKLTFQGFSYSKSAAKKIVDAGGKIE